MSVTNGSGHDAACLAPLAQWHEGNHSHSHLVQFYAEDSFLLHGLSEYIGSALTAGDAAVVIATETHRNGLAERIAAQGINLAEALEQGRYLAFDASAVLSQCMSEDGPDEPRFSEFLGGIMTRARAATGRENPRTAVFGEMVALLWAEGKWEAAIRLEEIWNQLSRTHSFTLRCAYPMSGFPREEHGEWLREICAKHSDVIPAETYTGLTNEEERLRNIAHLQQRALALATEVAERRETEKLLRRREAELRESEAGLLHAKADLESVVEQRTAALRKLSSRVLSLQDHERRRIARELHDSLGQYLVGLKLNIDRIRHSPKREELWPEAEELMERCIVETRTLSYLLHPPMMEEAGLASAVRWYVDGIGQRSPLTVTLDIAQGLGRLPDAVEMAVFRILQEALTNVHLHSGAQAAKVRIMRDAKSVILEVADDGRGIDANLLQSFNETGTGAGVGLMGLRERAHELGGRLILSSGNPGACLTVTIPINADPPVSSARDASV